MKTSISLFALALAAAVPAQAQLFTPATVGGAALGAVAGGVIGNNTGSRNHGTEGAIIGAVAGGLLGSSYAQSRREAPSPYYNTYGNTYGSAPRYYYSSGPGYAPATYRATPAWARPSHTASTTLLGGVAGAIIGHNNGRRGWEGAAIGAGAGYLLGRVSEPSRVRYPAATSHYAPYAYYRQPVVVTTQAAPAAAQPQQITIINNYYGGASTPMSNANAMFGR